jgi:hypothetical protein
LEVFHTSQEPPNNGSESGHLGPFTLGVRANVQPKSSIPIGVKVEISPKGFFTLGVKAELDNTKTFQSAPKLLINAELLRPCIGRKAGKRIPWNLGGQFAALGGQCSSI